MIDLASLATPGNVNEITKILAKYQLMQSIGNAAEGYVTGENRKKNLETKMLELSLVEKRRALGFLDDDKYDDDKNQRHPLRNAMGMEAKRQLTLQDIIAQKNRLRPVMGEATLVPNLASVLKISSPEVSHGSSLVSVLKRFVPHG